MPQVKISSSLTDSHPCEDCFFVEIQYNPEKRYHCNLFTKHVTQNSGSCINHAPANEVAHAIVNHNSFSKKDKMEIISNIILKKIQREQYNAINVAVQDSREIGSFERLFETFCERKIAELENDDSLVSRKPVNGIPEPGWDKVRLYKETRRDENGTVYVRKIKLMMTVDGLSGFEVENLD